MNCNIQGTTSKSEYVGNATAVYKLIIVRASKCTVSATKQLSADLRIPKEHDSVNQDYEGLENFFRRGEFGKRTSQVPSHETMYIKQSRAENYRVGSKTENEMLGI